MERLEAQMNMLRRNVLKISEDPSIDLFIRYGFLRELVEFLDKILEEMEEDVDRRDLDL